MTIDVDGVVEDGVIKPERPLGLKEKTRVHVTIHVQEEAAPAKDDDPTGWKAAEKLIGCITEDLVADDVAENHDRYIYRHDE